MKRRVLWSCKWCVILSWLLSKLSQTRTHWHRRRHRQTQLYTFGRHTHEMTRSEALGARLLDCIRFNLPQLARDEFFVFVALLFFVQAHTCVSLCLCVCVWSVCRALDLVWRQNMCECGGYMNFISFLRRWIVYRLVVFVNMLSHISKHQTSQHPHVLVQIM